MIRRVQLAMLLVLACAMSISGSSSSSTAMGVVESGSSSACRPSRVCLHPEACKIMQMAPPATFGVKYITNVGMFTIRVTTAWAPPFARRFWQLAKLNYYQDARFYRVDVKDFSGTSPAAPPFVVQFGYKGKPEVDNCWDDRMTSNETAAVVAPGNQRGYVSMSMGAQADVTSATPYCTLTEASPYCAIGFSTNVFINYADNSRLDAPGFAIFGRVSDADMKVVDALYADYGEVADLCPEDGTSVHCNGFGDACKGVNMTQMLIDGNKYLKKRFSKLSFVKSIRIVK